MIYQLTQQQTRTIESVVPWFLSNMPASYFQQVPDEFRMDHIKAISAVKDANMDLYLNLKSHTHDGRTIYTFVRPSTQPGTLLSMVEELPYHPEESLSRLHVFSSNDHSMALNMFIYGDSPIKPRVLDHEPSQRILQFASEVQNSQHVEEYGLHPNVLFEKDNLQKYLSLCKDNYLNIISQHPERFLRQRLLYDKVSGTEGCEVHTEHAIHEVQEGYWVDVAMANSLPQVALEHTCRLLFVQGFDVDRARLDVIPDGDNGSVTLLRLLVRPLLHNGSTEEYDFSLLQSELKRSKWLDNPTMELVFETYPWLGVKRGEIITAMCHLMHPILAKHNAIVYSKHNILVRKK
jgi:glutamate dehydrogenase